SSLRYTKGAQALRAGKAGKVLGAEAYSPCELEKHHPDLFWYGVHGVEALFTIMGPGCVSVTRVQTPDTELVTGTWKDGRIGRFGGMHKGSKGYGALVFGSKGILPSTVSGSYEPL